MRAEEDEIGEVHVYVEKWRVIVYLNVCLSQNVVQLQVWAASDGMNPSH